MNRYFFLFLLPALLIGCDSSDPNCETIECCDGDADCLPAPANVYVGNQGNFSDGDGSVTAYDSNSETTTEPIRDLGSIVQSIATDGLRLYVASNTGGRVDVYDVGSEAGIGDRVAQVAVENPRYVAFSPNEGAQKLYVTSQLYDRPSEVVVVDKQTFEVTQTVEVGGFAEGIVHTGARVFVATGAFGATQEVVVLDATTDEVVQRIDVGCTAPRSLALDGDGEVWVFCAGGSATDTTPEVEGEVVVLDAATGEVVTRIAVDGRIETAGPGQDVYRESTRLFAVRDQDTVLRFETGTNTLGATLPVDGDPIGAVAYDGFYDRLYLTRVPGFSTAGSVTIHESDGTQTGAFTAGVAPTSIVLYP